MKRRAILIAAPGVPDSGADNAPLDVVAWRSFLIGVSGGAWDDAEINDDLVNPSRAQLNAVLEEAADCDYAIVTFSGHGRGEVVNGELTTMVLPCPSESAIPYYELRPRSARTLLVLDSCRWAPQAIVEKFAAKRLTSVGEKVERTVYREYFDAQVMRCERGSIILYGCGIGQESRDWYSETTPGGLYTHALLGAAKGWAATAAGKAALDVVQAHRLAAPDVTRRNPEQAPDIRHGRRLGVFPLAVNL
jgi:hypothetical protein